MQLLNVRLNSLIEDFNGALNNNVQVFVFDNDDDEA
jgi:hypothetical protein